MQHAQKEIAAGEAITEVYQQWKRLSSGSQYVHFYEWGWEGGGVAADVRVKPVDWAKVYAKMDRR